jgi:hypothetical protein
MVPSTRAIWASVSAEPLGEARPVANNVSAEPSRNDLAPGNA